VWDLCCEMLLLIHVFLLLHELNLGDIQEDHEASAYYWTCCCSNGPCVLWSCRRQKFRCPFMLHQVCIIFVVCFYWYLKPLGWSATRCAGYDVV